MLRPFPVPRGRVRGPLILGMALVLMLSLVSTVFAQTPPPPKPGPPSDLEVTALESATGTTVTVGWGKPAQQAGIVDGELRYDVWWWDYTPPAGWNKATATQNLTAVTANLSGLREGMSHQIQVRAYQVDAAEEHRGAWATTSATPYQTLSAPQNVVSTPGNEQLTVTWEAPNDSTGAVSYQVEWTTRTAALATDTGADGWSSAGVGAVEENPDVDDGFMAVISGVENGVTTYRVRVTVSDGYDQMNQAVVNGGTPAATVPSAPDAPMLERQEDKTALAVSWTAPMMDGGSDITGYSIYYVMVTSDTPPTPDASPTSGIWNHMGTGTNALITGLDADEEYYVYVRAGNDHNGDTATEWGAWSEAASTAEAMVVEPMPTPTDAAPTVVTRTVTVTRTVAAAAPAPAPQPAGPSIIGDSGYATTYLAVDGQSIELRVHPQAGGPAMHTFMIGGFVRDADLGQTYQIVAGGLRRWIAPDSPLVYQVPWAVVNSSQTFPSLVIAAIPLDESNPPMGFLVRGLDGRIVSYVGMWRHIPNIATFQALGYRWCDVNIADAGFFGRISEGSAHPTTSQPEDPNYPSCG